MGKRLLSLCMVLILCLTLLPATALAAENAPTTLYVGNYQITNGNATTYLKAGSTQGSLVEGSENDWTVKYDPSTATMTLNVATITGNDNISSVPYGAGIYAQCNSGQPVTLTIELIGENIITGNYGIYVNAEMSANSYGTDASLNITGNGSLIVTGTNSHGLFVKSGTGNASLTINDASVVANTTHTYSGPAGICVQSSVSATSSPNLSLAVDGGSLTASGTGNSDGILLYVGSSQATGATTSLTVTDNAIVRAKNGIKAERVDKPTPSGAGIVFDGTEGTVYGDVTLQEDLEIDEGESLTIPDGSSLTIPDNKTLTVDGGELTGNVPQSGVTYKVTEVTLDKDSLTLEVGGSETLTATITPDNATEQDVAWSSDNENVAKVENGKVTAVGAGSTTIKATVDGKSAECSVTVNAPATVPVTGVSLNKTELTLTEGNSETLTATVEPSDAANKNVTWTSSNTSVATVDTNGKVTAVGAGEATITVTTADGGFTDTCEVTVKVPVTGVTLDKTSLSLEVGDTAQLSATVQPEEATNKAVTWTSSNTGVATVDTNGKVTAVGAGTAQITVTTADGSHTATCAVTVKEPYTPPPYIPPTKTPSQQAIDKIEDAREGSTVKITLRTGQTKLDKEVFEELAGRDVTLEISLPGGVTWTVNGEDIPKTADLTDLDLGVSLNTSTIPAAVINAVSGEIGTVQLTLKHDGPFGFTMTLTAPVGVKNAGLWANLYHYDEDAGEMVYQSAAQVDEDGNAALPFDHASQYAIVIDEKSHDLPFTDLGENQWYESAVAYAYRHNIMEGTSDTTFVPGKSLTRAEAVQVLYNLEGQPEVSGNVSFPDLVYEWYKPAIAWAEQTGVVDGYEDGTFRPDEPVTREEFSQMLYNYAAYKDYDLTAKGDLTSFPDGDSVQEWALPAMTWANGNSLINGHDDGTLEPGGTTTRAQAASILMRLDQNVVEE